MTRGNAPGRFGSYEIFRTFDWKSLLLAVVLAATGWLSTEVIPVLQNQEGLGASLGIVLAFVVRFVLELIRDNSDKPKKPKAKK
jgi:hypothetical protein